MLFVVKSIPRFAAYAARKKAEATPVTPGKLFIQEQLNLNVYGTV